MADIELVIKVPECFYEYCKAQTDAIEIQLAVANGTPLEKHDEEVIKETVESIWGKPPYTEMLDKIRAEIEPTRKMYLEMNNIDWLNGCDYVLSVIDKYKAESEEEE